MENIDVEYLVEHEVGRAINNGVFDDYIEGYESDLEELKREFEEYVPGLYDDVQKIKVDYSVALLDFNRRLEKLEGNYANTLKTLKKLAQTLDAILNN